MTFHVQTLDELDTEFADKVKALGPDPNWRDVRAIMKTKEAKMRYMYILLLKEVGDERRREL